MILITNKEISPEEIINQVRTTDSGCVVTYVGLIRDNSKGKLVHTVEYDDAEGKAESRLGEIADEIKQRWPINDIAICHRVGKLNVGDINLVVAIAAAHRVEGFAACQYAIDTFKEKLPTRKMEIYVDGSRSTG